MKLRFRDDFNPAAETLQGSFPKRLLRTVLPAALNSCVFRFFATSVIAVRDVARLLDRLTELKGKLKDHIEVEGVVSVVLPGTMFRVALDNKHMVLATISGKMRKRWVRLTVGDRVKMEMSPYDLDKARITWRLR